MSNLFRYNLKTSEQFVALNQELKVVQDYVYIQQMRFGSRIRYDSDIQVNGDVYKRQIWDIMSGLLMRI